MDGEMMSDFEKLSQVFVYEPETGIIRWKIATHCCGKSDGRGMIYPGDIAGTRMEGRVAIGYQQRVYRAHRIAWLLMTGSWPSKGTEIDHKNGNPADNRWENLRLATKAQNTQNHPIRKDNSSGVKGVSWMSQRGVWDARISVNGKVHILGRHAKFEDAVAARRAAETAYHGEFARKQET